MPHEHTHTHTQEPAFQPLTKLQSAILLLDWSEPLAYFNIADRLRWKVWSPDRFAKGMRELRELGLTVINDATGRYSLTDEGRRHITKAEQNATGWVSKEV